jgi:hypothetical protein
MDVIIPFLCGMLATKKVVHAKGTAHTRSCCQKRRPRNSLRATRYTLPYFQVIRAKMILLAAQGLGNDEIAARLNTRREVVSMWRKRFFELFLSR